ncbi:MAG: hypothetical protein NTX65_11815 [Ignavibacteriales bacterium]|nr:hypothetical protein [Ignavibacteriales bacterium]
MNEHFINLFEYNIWANNRIFSALKLVLHPTQKILEIMSHLVLSQETWLGRIQGKHTNSFWDKVELDLLEKRSQLNNEEWLKLLNSSSKNDLVKKYSYQNTKGESFETSLQDIITHIINHSTYHRAQINLLLRQNGHEPAVTDYIYYTRR